jgi:hypothetical protein
VKTADARQDKRSQKRNVRYRNKKKKKKLMPCLDKEQNIEEALGMKQDS